MSGLFVHGARQLITLRGEPGPRRGTALGQLNIIDDGAVLIEAGVIREVGPTRRLENLAAVRKAREISAVGRVVMPGFVDCHTHLISSPSGLPEEAQEPGSLKTRTGAGFLREASSRRLTSDALHVIRQGLEHGTTTIEAKCGYGANAAAELKALRVLLALGDAPITLVPTFAASPVIPGEYDGCPEEYVHWLAGELLPTIHRRGLARFFGAISEPGQFTANQLRALYTAARDLGFPLKISLSQCGPSDGVDLIQEFVFTSADHLDHIDERGAALLAASGSIAALTPASSFFLGAHKYPPARTLIDRGIPIALGSNYNRTLSPTNNMQVVIFLACRHMGMSPAEAVSAATINGAYALKLGHRTGSLEVGKQADLVVLAVGDYRELAHGFGINLVEVTIRNGTVVSQRSGEQWPQAS